MPLSMNMWKHSMLVLMLNYDVDKAAVCWFNPADPQ